MTGKKKAGTKKKKVDSESIKKRGPAYDQSEIECLLELVEQQLPVISYAWEALSRDHVVYWPDTKRDAKSLKRKFDALSNSKAPTGDPNCPPNVLWAKRIRRKINDTLDYSSAGSGGSSFEGENDNDDDDDDDDDDDSANILASAGTPSAATPTLGVIASASASAVSVSAASTTTTDKVPSILSTPTTKTNSFSQVASSGKRQKTSQRSRGGGYKDTNNDDNNFNMNDYFKNQLLQQKEAKAQREEDRIQRRHEMEMEKNRQTRTENMMMMMFNPMMMAQQAKNNSTNPMMGMNPMMMHMNPMPSVETGNMNPQLEVSEEEKNDKNGEESKGEEKNEPSSI